MERGFGSLKMMTVALKVFAAFVAATGAVLSLMALVEVFQYFDPYYIEDILYYVTDLVFPVVIFVVSIGLAMIMWAAGDLIRLLLAIEENTRPAAGEATVVETISEEV